MRKLVVATALLSLLAATGAFSKERSPSDYPWPPADWPPVDFGWPPAGWQESLGQPPARGPASGLALEAVQVAVATCLKEHANVAAIVVDSAGQPVAALTADGSARIAFESAKRKAFVVLYTKRPSADAFDRVRSDIAFARELAATGKAAPFGGGLPITVGSALIGAIAVSGAPPGPTDEMCARVGLDKIAALLR